jgi:hypothetical protein
VYDDEEDEAMEAMLGSASAEEPGKPERESPEQVIGQIKSMVSELQALAAKL